jgi:PAS domain S-box-containing protein
MNGRPVWWRKIDGRVVLALAALIVLAVAGVLLSFRLIANERERELRTWQVRLNIVADGRFVRVDSWLNAQFAEMSALADNPSVQLYVTQMVSATTPAEKSDAEAQGEYLRNLLTAIATRAGFVQPQQQQQQEAVPANVQAAGTSGIAILDTALKPLVATAGFPPVDGPLKTFLEGLAKGQRGLLDMYLDAAGQPAMGFAVPVISVQGEGGADDQVGWLVGIKEVGPELFPLLKQPGETAQTAIGFLVRSTGQVIEYLSPVPDHEKPLELKMAVNTPNLDAGFAIANPRVFDDKHVDYGSRRVLMTSRSFSQAPWTLIYEVQRAEAMGPAESRFSGLLAALLLAIALVAALIIAVWRHASSRRSREAAQQAQQAASRLAEQRNLLRLVTDSQHASIFILDTEGRYLFANRQAAEGTGLQSQELNAKTIASVLGPHTAKRYVELNERALEGGRLVSDVEPIQTPSGERVVQSEHIPLEATSDMPRSVLTVEHDITEAVRERERRTRTLDRLVRTLVSVVDRRDPYSARHSARVAQLAKAVATEMGLSPTEIETAEIAGNLLNLGKILVDRDVLTRSGQLSLDERQLVRQSVLAGADLLEGIEFDGPVVETLRQAQCHWDGSGVPAGVKGEDILISARVIAVANAFVGMTSRRAHRAAMSVDQAVETLLRGVGKEFDRRVVAALINWLDNRGGRAIVEAAAEGDDLEGPVEQPVQPQ